MFRPLVAVLLCCCATFSTCAPETGAQGVDAFRDIRITPDRNPVAEQSGLLRADAKEIAELLEIAPVVERLRLLKSSGSGRIGTRLTRADQSARLLCLWKIMMASEEVRKVVAEIDLDIATAFQNVGELNAKRANVQNTLNTLNFMQGGVLGITKNSMALAGKSPTTRQVLAISSFGTSTLLSSVNLFLPSIWARKSDGKPNALARIFNASYRPDNAEESYLWRFFNSPVPGSTVALNRKQILVKHWESFGGLKLNQRNDAVLAGTADEQTRESIRLINQRISLLEDMKTHIEEFDASLYELHQAISLEET